MHRSSRLSLNCINSDINDTKFATKAGRTTNVQETSETNMSQEWGSLPLLPLRCILEHLSTEDALAAMSTCRHWRNAVLLYEGHKETLKLRAKHLEKSLFLTRIFRRHTRKLHIYLDCNEPALEKYINFVLPQFFDTAKLQELIFIGPSYIQQNHRVPFVKLNRIITESLLFKHSRCIQKLAFMGCEMGIVKSDNEKYSHKHVEYYSRPLKFGGETAADTVLSSTNAGLIALSTLKHIIVDYEQINTAALDTLSTLHNFTQLSLNITDNRPLAMRPLDWHRVPATLHVAVNIIGVPSRRFNDIIENVLVEGLPLTSLKVLFCKSMCTRMLNHLTSLYQSSLRELVWADGPQDYSEPNARGNRPARHQQMDDFAFMNPFVLLCWQCVQLRRLVIHGYWVWQYDLLGFVRLRKTLAQLEVSSIYDKQDKFKSALEINEEGTLRVLAGDAPSVIDPEYIQEVNAVTEFNWKPAYRSKLHPALRSRPTAAQRADYVLHETMMPFGVASHGE